MDSINFQFCFHSICCNFPWWLFDWKLGSWPNCPIILQYPKREKQFQCKWCGRHCACKQNENVSYMKDWGGEKTRRRLSTYEKVHKKGQKKCENKCTRSRWENEKQKKKKRKKKNATQRMSTEMLITPETTMLLLLLLLLFFSLLSLTLCAASILHQVLHCILPTPLLRHPPWQSLTQPGHALWLSQAKQKHWP